MVKSNSITTGQKYQMWLSDKNIVKMKNVFPTNAFKKKKNQLKYDRTSSAKMIKPLTSQYYTIISRHFRRFDFLT